MELGGRAFSWLLWYHPLSFFQRLKILNPFARVYGNLLPRLRAIHGPEAYGELDPRRYYDLPTRWLQGKKILLAQPDYYQKEIRFIEREAPSGDFQRNYLVPIHARPEENFEKISRSAKKNLEKKFFEVRILDSQEEQIYFRKLQDFRRRKRLSSAALGIDSRLISLIPQEPGRLCRIVGAFYQDKMVAGLGLLGWNGILLEVGSFRETEIPYPGHPQDHIKWFVLSRARAWGFETYDLGCLPVNDSSEQDSGLKRFKKKWGGEEILFPVLRDSCPFKS